MITNAFRHWRSFPLEFLLLGKSVIAMSVEMQIATVRLMMEHMDSIGLSDVSRVLEQAYTTKHGALLKVDLNSMFDGKHGRYERLCRLYLYTTCVSDT